MWSTTWAMSFSVISRARLRWSAEVEDDLDQALPIGQGVDRRDDLLRQRREEDVEIVGGCLLLLPVLGCHPG